MTRQRERGEGVKSIFGALYDDQHAPAPRRPLVESRTQLNAVFVAHPKLQHVALTTANLDAMIDWYHKVLGMRVNHRSPPRGPWSSIVFIGNDEVHHRIAFFETSDPGANPAEPGHTRLRQVAFEYEKLDDLLGAYVRLKRLGIAPALAADQGLQTAIYYRDPDQNIVELNVNNYGDPWTATENMRSALPMMIDIDPDQMVAAHETGASPWELHERARAGEFAPAEPYDALNFI
jgi:catechol 2,3-dioxygenase